MQKGLTSMKLYFSAAILSVIAFIVLGGLYIEAAGSDMLARVSSSLHLAASEAEYFYSFKLPENVRDGFLAGAYAAFGGGSPSLVATSTATNGTAESIPVLLYHGEGGDAQMSFDTFAKQLRALKAAGWNTVTLEQFDEFMRQGATLPAKSFLLTFDDGRRDTYYSADPVLADLHYTAVMFVITGFSLPTDGNPADFYLNEEQLKAMKASGRWELESHGDQDHREYSVPSATSTSASLTLVPNEHLLANKFWLPAQNRVEIDQEFSTRVTADLMTSKQILESDFLSPVTAFAYPFNDFGQDGVNYPESEGVLNAIVPTIYTDAFYQTWPGNGDSFNYPFSGGKGYLVKRIEPGPDWTANDLLATLTNGAAKALPYAAPSFGSDWASNWGVVKIGTTLLMQADASSTGSAAFLDGTESWTNYRLAADIKDNFGTVSLIARHTENEQPYLACSFSDTRVILEEHSGDTEITLASVPYHPKDTENFSASMTVSGNTASCSAGSVTAYGSANGILAGQVGIGNWDPEAGTAHSTITSFSASPLTS